MDFNLRPPLLSRKPPRIISYIRIFIIIIIIITSSSVGGRACARLLRGLLNGVVANARARNFIHNIIIILYYLVILLFSFVVSIRARRTANVLYNIILVRQRVRCYYYYYYRIGIEYYIVLYVCRYVVGALRKRFDRRPEFQLPSLPPRQHAHPHARASPYNNNDNII